MTDLTFDVAVLSGAAVAANLFCLLYFALAPWYRSVEGRASWSMTFSVALLLDVALVAYWLHWTVPPWLAHVIYFVIFIACWLKLGALVQRQFIEYRRRSRSTP